MFYIINAAKFTHFEKSAKNTFLVNSKKWKKWVKGSSKQNHPKVALSNCHYFVNSDPHAKIYENPTGRFWEQISFSGILVVLISLLYLWLKSNQKVVKTTIFNQLWRINDQNPLNWLWQVRIYHQKSFFPISENFNFLKNKCWVTNVKNHIFSKSPKNFFQLN